MLFRSLVHSSEHTVSYKFGFQSTYTAIGTKAFLLVSLLFSLSSCSGGTSYVGTSGSGSTDDVIQSGIYTESSAYYINVDSQSAPSDGNGAW